ncbi:cytochrome c3 family protein [Pseudoneobacillus rhizosphaerae]|uniref:Fibronectin type-III domain-containing protein n=1 Tax=Pseudoneobacillus rhizosphaerae TaxID=2880968 RepID=A0A9C7G9H6_9BACI|nr:cytochrome c3 family protein [Pseudoneobacillus rhizosphaerae]CAG9608449.1 hypothetical protein NEOCIP111885_02143 [Pseudoneobacillus rhizosphaerae]
MSKVKLSFSFLLTLLLVGMFSVVAFAAAPSAPSVKYFDWKNGNIHVGWTWTAASGGATNVTYKIFVDGDTAGIDVPVASGNSYVATGLTSTDNHTFQVAATTTDGISGKSTLVTVVPEKANNEAMVGLDGKPIPEGEVDNGINNAHKTGVGQVVKNPGNQLDNAGKIGAHKLHGSYQNNTNSCASCHQTHTAASSGLLFKNGAYNTCTACHDGTLGFYNVFGTSNAEDMGAGTFGGTHDGNMSVHMATGALEISAAPGSNAKVGTTWSAEFTCASCHDPHGSYSDRLLSVNPNGMATVERKSVNSTVYGNKLMEVSVYETMPTANISATNLNDYAFKDITISAADIAAPVFDTATPPKIITPAGYYYNTGLKVGDRVLQLQRYIGSWQNAPGVYLTKQGINNTSYWPKLYKDTTLVWPPAVPTSEPGKTTVANANKQDATDGKYWFNNSKAFYKVPGTKGDGTINKITEVQKAYVVQLGYLPSGQNKLGGVVNPAANGYQPLVTDNNYLTTTGKGIQMNEWCGACHVDYFTRTKTNTGVDGNYNHHTMSDSYNCERCHYAHGTDAKIMRDAQGSTLEDLTATGGKFVGNQVKAIEYLKDQNDSSALKRFTNMAVCYGCHTSSHAEGFINNNEYNTTDSNNGFQSGSVTKGQKLIPWGN